MCQPGLLQPATLRIINAELAHPPARGWRKAQIARRAALGGLLGCLTRFPSRAADRSLGLKDVAVVKAFFMVRDPWRLLADAAYRIEAFTARDEKLFETSDDNFDHYVFPDKEDKFIQVPAMRVRADGFVLIHVKQGMTVYEATCGMGPIIDGTVYFRIDPVLRETQDTFVQQTPQNRVTTYRWVEHLWDVRIAPRAGIV